MSSETRSSSYAGRRQRLGRALDAFVKDIEASAFENIPQPNGFRRLFRALRVGRRAWKAEANR